MREIEFDASFKRRYKRFSKSRPELKDKFLSVLTKLKKDIRAESLFTHKLTGELKDYHVCRINYDLRLVFSYDDEKVYLMDIGTHDEVY